MLREPPARVFHTLQLRAIPKGSPQQPVENSPVHFPQR